MIAPKLIHLLFLMIFVQSYGSNAGKSEAPRTLITKKQPFSRGSMESSLNPSGVSGFSLLNPSRFNMQQSYSTSFTSNGQNSMSAGVYLNTLSYQLFNPLVFSIDLGVYTPFHSNFSNSNQSGNQPMNSEFIIPRVGLDYRPSSNTLISIQFLNLNSANQAYRPFGYSRSPFLR